MRTTALNPITSSPESPGEADSLPVWSASAALFADPLSRSLVCFIAGLCSERERQQVKDGDYSRLHSHLLRLLPKAEFTWWHTATCSRPLPLLGAIPTGIWEGQEQVQQHETHCGLVISKLFVRKAVVPSRPQRLTCSNSSRIRSRLSVACRFHALLQACLTIVRAPCSNSCRVTRPEVESSGSA